VGDDFLELAGEDIFGDVAVGGGFVWMASLEGLIQVDPETMDATWHTDLAPGRNIVYAFDSLWLSVSSGLLRVDPTSLEEIATIRIAEPEGVAADRDSIWTSQHDPRVVLRIDPQTNKIIDTIDVAPKSDEPGGKPMDPSVVDGDIWVAMGNGNEVVRIDGKGKVTRFELEREVLTPAVATPEAIWFSNWLNLDRTVTRIDRATGVVSSAELPPSALDSRPGQIGPGIYVGDTLWFPTTGGTMVAIDPVTFDLLGTVTLQGSVPRKAVEYDGAIWVASEFKGSLERIPLERLADGLAAGS
jgi:DNA-binding beta-propeller fold protein YncE